MNGTEKIFVLGFWCGSEWMGREFRHKMDEACERYRNQTEEVRQECRTELRRHADELTQIYEEQWNGIEEKFEQLDREWRRKYEELDNQWRRYLHDFAERISGEITKVVSYAVASAVRDLKTVNKICRAIRAGFAQLRAIDAAAEVERDPGAPLS
jgi:glutamate formiminotransferase